jgi:rod shape-determining protein MreC
MPRFLKDRRNALILAGLLFAQLLLVSLQVPRGSEPSAFETIVFTLASPLHKAVHGIIRGASSAWNRYIYLRRVESQNERLQDEIFHLRQENMILANDLVGYRDARELAAGLAGIGEPFLVAAVISIDALNPFSSIVIDRGSDGGMRTGMAVVDRSGWLVGRVVTPVSARTATVQLVTDDASAVSVRSETSLVQGVLAGNTKGGTCWLRYVLATDDALAVGEELLTSGFDKVFPAGLKAGTVESVALDGSLFKRIVVRSHLDWRRMSRVAVLTRTIDAPDAETR